jgi:hypothetical protein
MNSWMKRRIDRSRARCQKSADSKEPVRREKQETGRSKQEAKSPRELSHPASDK